MDQIQSTIKSIKDKKGLHRILFGGCQGGHETICECSIDACCLKVGFERIYIVILNYDRILLNHKCVCQSKPDTVYSGP